MSDILIHGGKTLIIALDQKILHLPAMVSDSVCQWSLTEEVLVQPAPRWLSEPAWEPFFLKSSFLYLSTPKPPLGMEGNSSPWLFSMVSL